MKIGFLLVHINIYYPANQLNGLFAYLPCEDLIDIFYYNIVMSKSVDNRCNNAISALTYGFNCFIWQSRSNKLYDCILSIHEEYINILHLIIAKKVSYLLKLNQIYNITETEYSTQSKLKEFNITHYIILYTQSLQSFVFAFRTQYQKQQLKIALVLFVRQAKLYYQRLNQFDPFKAEAMMTFLHADKDGGNMLDIEEIQNILHQMRIVKDKEEVQADIEEIDKYLYEREKMKRPKDMTNAELNQLGFQYLLRYYSIKDDLARYFCTYCPMFKLKVRSQKNLIVDIVRYNEKPIMSASQLCDFYQKVLVQKTSEQQCLKLIKSFPVYDGQGKQKTEENDMISFNNFCSLLSSKRNSSYQQEKKESSYQLKNPISDYFIYSDLSNYSSRKSNSSRINFYELSLKRGCRCLGLLLQSTKQGELIVRFDADNRTSIEEVLKIIFTKAFQFNYYPLILKVQHSGLNKTYLDKFAKIVKTIFEQQLYTLPLNFQEHETLPSPHELQKKILIMANANLKLLKAKQKEFPDQSLQFFKIVSLFASKLDFERKGQFCWNYCSLEQEKVRKFEQDEDEHFSNYTKKIIVKVQPTITKGSEVNISTSLAMRLGIQLIGLTFNSINQENYILQSLFLENGGAKCGYISKPNWMCLKNPKTLYSKNFEFPLFLLNLKAISAQSCIINEQQQSSYYLQVFIRGNKKQQEVNKKFTSKVQVAGYYTKFNLQCEFTVYCLDLAVLVLLIRGEKTNKILSGRAIPIRYLREGLRPVFLMGDNFKETSSSYIYIHSQKKDIPKKIHSYLQSKN